MTVTRRDTAFIHALVVNLLTISAEDEFELTYGDPDEFKSMTASSDITLPLFDVTGKAFTTNNFSVIPALQGKIDPIELKEWILNTSRHLASIYESVEAHQEQEMLVDEIKSSAYTALQKLAEHSLGIQPIMLDIERAAQEEMALPFRMLCSSAPDGYILSNSIDVKDARDIQRKMAHFMPMAGTMGLRKLVIEIEGKAHTERDIELPVISLIIEEGRARIEASSHDDPDGVKVKTRSFTLDQINKAVEIMDRDGMAYMREDYEHSDWGQINNELLSAPGQYNPNALVI